MKDPKVSLICNNKQEATYNPYNYAAIYARQSSKSDSFSIPSQVDDCKQKLLQNNLLLYKVYEDKESGKKDYQSRESFTSLLSDLYAGMFKTVFVIRMDRLSRRIDDFLKIKNIFKKHDVNVVYVKEPQLNFDNSYMSTFIQNMIMAVSTFEPDNINDRTSFGKAEARKKGRYKISANLPYGFIKDESNQLVIDPHRKDIIVAAFQKYYQFKMNPKKYPQNVILTDLNQMEEDLKNRLLKDHGIEYEPQQFTSSFITSMVQRPIYAGLMLLDPAITLKQMIYLHPGKIEYTFDDSNFVYCSNVKDAPIEEGFWKKLVIKHLEDKVNKPLEEEEYLFKNLLYCGTCNSYIKKFGNEYACKKKCFIGKQEDLIPLLFAELILGTSNEDIESEIKKSINEINDVLKNKKNSLKAKEKGLRQELCHHLIDNDNYNELVKTQLESWIKSNDELKDEIHQLGEKLRKLQECIEGINLFKFQMAEFSSDDITFVISNWEYVHNLLSRIIKRVVLRKKSHERKCKIQYLHQ